MADPFIGEIRPFAFDFAPRGWAHCNGQLMPISQNVALFSIISATFGGDGKTTFGLPNLQGRVAVGAGAGPGLTPRPLGEIGGSDTVSLTKDQIPVHRHEMRAAGVRSADQTPGASTVLNLSLGGPAYSTAAPTTPLSDTSLSSAPGHSQPHNNLMPYLTVNFCIALEGHYPQRP